MSTTKKRKSLGTFGILLCVLLLVAAVSWLVAGKPYTDAEGVEQVVHGATLHDILMAPINGFHDAGDVIGFVFCLGAFLAIVNKTGALEAGIQALVKKLHGRELVLIPILMFVFSIGGTTYGMCEETVGFYILLASTMLAAGLDPMVGAAVVLLGAGVGVLGSTINPFATGAAVAAAGVDVNMGKVYLLGVILWLGSYAIATWFVLQYAKKIKAGKGSILTKEQLEECQEAYGGSADKNDVKLTGKQKAVLWIFGATFVIMIFGFIPWMDLLGEEKGLALFGWSEFLTGQPFGWWWFDDAATWFILMGLIIGLIGMENKGEMSKTVCAGVADMVSVNLVIALARATSVLMATTGLGNWLVEASVTALSKSGMSAPVFGFLDYLLHLGLSFLVPSSSGLAGLSSPIVSPIVAGMKWSVETSIMILVAANGLINLFTPTCGAIMGGLALARIPWATWVKWAWKVILIIGIFAAVVLVGGMILL